MHVIRNFRLTGPATVFLLGIMLLPACGRSPVGDGSPRVSVVATTTILGDVARNLIGSDGTVDVLFPAGADPHDYQPSARQIVTLEQADLVIASGLGLEQGLGDALASAAADGANILSVGEEVDPLYYQDGAPDPHFWLDPLRMIDAARVIAAELEIVASGPDWEGRAEAYGADLAAADSQIKSVLSVVPADERKLVTDHESLNYFAARYEFTVIGSVMPGGATLRTPSSQELASLIALIVEQGVRAIFAETTEPTTLADAVAAEVGGGVPVVELYTGSLGAPGSGADTLIGMLLANADLIAAALQ